MLEVEESRALLDRAELVFDAVCCEAKLKELATRTVSYTHLTLPTTPYV